MFALRPGLDECGYSPMPAYASPSPAATAVTSAARAALAEPQAEQAGKPGRGRPGLAVVHDGHADRGGRLDVRLDVVDEHAPLRGQAEQAGRVPEDALLGLAHAHLRGDHPGVEQLGE